MRTEAEIRERLAQYENFDTKLDQICQCQMCTGMRASSLASITTFMWILGAEFSEVMERIIRASEQTREAVKKIAESN